jgi:hypothetical protein
MPPKGYRHLSVKEEVYRRLKEFARSKGLSSVNDAVVLLLEYSDIYSKLEYIPQKGVGNLPQTEVNQKQSLSDTLPEVFINVMKFLEEIGVLHDEFPYLTELSRRCRKGDKEACDKLNNIFEKLKEIR